MPKQKALKASDIRPAEANVGKEKAMNNVKKAILIIDDDTSISRAFSRILERNG